MLLRLGFENKRVLVPPSKHTNLCHVLESQFSRVVFCFLSVFLFQKLGAKTNLVDAIDFNIVVPHSEWSICWAAPNQLRLKKVTIQRSGAESQVDLLALPLFYLSLSPLMIYYMVIYSRYYTITRSLVTNRKYEPFPLFLWSISVRGMEQCIKGCMIRSAGTNTRRYNSCRECSLKATQSLYWA